MKTVVMVPTYNEAGNIGRLIREILGLAAPGFELHVLVVDDNSPDGTGRMVAELGQTDPRVILMTRVERRGRGSAGIDGFRRALELGADLVVEMDADFSHDPKFLPDLLRAVAQGADVSIGSRFVAGGADNDRGLYRQAVTRLAGIYVRALLGLRVRDVSSGYRCFSRAALERLGLDDLISTGPSIILEILFKCARNGMRIREVPIIFVDRREGETKLNPATLLKTLAMVLRLKRQAG